jgi:ribose transport system substrate-binding protein
MLVRSLIAGAAVLAVTALTGGASADLLSAKANVAQYASTPVFSAPGPAVNAAKAKGKTVFVIPDGSEAPDVSSMAALTTGIAQAGTAAGLHVSTCSNNATMSGWNMCFKKAMARKVSLIVLAGSLDLTSLQTQLAAAAQAKIPVIATHVLNPGDFPTGVDSVYRHALTGLTATVTAPYAQAAKLMADYVIATANGAATRIVIAGASDVPESAAMLATLQNEFAYACGTSCTVSTIDVPAAQWQTQGIAMVQKATLAQPTQYLIPLFDGLSSIAAQGEADARAAYSAVIRPSICTFGGSAFAIQMGQAANRVVCDVAENMNWTGWATIDQALRVLTGNAPVQENLPLRIWTAGGAPWPTSSWFSGGMTFPPATDAGWGDPGSTYQAGYAKLWGLS